MTNWINTSQVKAGILRLFQGRNSGQENQMFLPAVISRKSANGRQTLQVNERIVEKPFALSRLCSLPSKSRILELGCTSSYMSISLAALGYQVTGVDLVSYNLRHPNFRFIEGDFLTVKIAGKFDAFVAISALEHSGLQWYGDSKFDTADIEIMTRVRALLCEKGIVIITVPFGKAAVINKNNKPFQRIYDKKRLDLLMNGFAVKEQRYFYTEDSLSWLEGTKEYVGKMETVKRCNGVALLLARKEK